MSNKKSKKSIEKEPIKVREKTLPSGNKSLYLDIYYKGKRRYEFLNRYLVPETTQANKIANKETLQYANTIKAQRTIERNKKEIIYLYPDEINILSKTPCPNIMVKNAFLYACFTGLRFGDIEALTWGKLQTDGNGNTMLPYIQKKTGKQEYLPICSDAMLFLPDKTGKSSDDLIFTLPNNGYTNIILKEWILSAGITKKITFHVARHTTATLLLSNNVPIEIISKILGHSDIKTTQDFYAAVMEKNKRAAVNTLNGIIN